MTNEDWSTVLDTAKDLDWGVAAQVAAVVITGIGALATYLSAGGLRRRRIAADLDLLAKGQLGAKAADLLRRHADERTQDLVNQDQGTAMFYGALIPLAFVVSLVVAVTSWAPTWTVVILVAISSFGLGLLFGRARPAHTEVESIPRNDCGYLIEDIDEPDKAASPPRSIQAATISRAAEGAGS